MSERGRELVATDKPTVGSKPFLDAIVMEDGESNGCFSNPPCADESDRGEIFCEANDLLDQILAPKTGPRWRGRRLSEDSGWKYQIPGSSIVGITNLV